MEGATLARSRCNSHLRVSWRRFWASRCAVYSGSQGGTDWDFSRMAAVPPPHNDDQQPSVPLSMDGDAPSVMGSPELEDHYTFVIENVCRAARAGPHPQSQRDQAGGMDEGRCRRT